jgi:hypothetical protein
VRSVPTSAQVLAAAGQVGRAKARAKWPPEVSHVNQNSGRAVKPFTTIFDGRTLTEATLKLAEWADGQ